MNDHSITAGPAEQPAGAVFHRCALQVNPGHYRSTFRGDSAVGDPQDYANSMVQRAYDIGVSVLAITDHNNVDGVAHFRTAAEQYEITIFPGFELASSEGIHVLCVYPPTCTEEQLGRYLGHFGILRDMGPSSELSNKSFCEVINDVQQQGGMAIAAHATNDNGLFQVLNGTSRIRCWQDENLLAIQIPGPVDDLDYNIRQIVRNKNPDYSRPRIVAAVNAKDVIGFEDLEEPSATCWIKMSEVTIEGLRQAFLDPESRVRLNSDPVPEEHTELLSISWLGGFLDGTTIRLNPNLNVLVGGRGAGKSAIVESLRYVLGKEPLGDEASKAHDGMIKHVLRSGTKISLRVRSHRPTTNEYLIERIVNNPPVVLDSNGQVSELTPEDILPRLDVYGQHEISELTRSPEKLTQLLSRFIDRNDDSDTRKTAALRAMVQTRTSLTRVRSDLDGIDADLAKLPSLQETQKRYREAGLEERLSERSHLVKEERVVETVAERLAPLQADLTSLRGHVAIDRDFLSSDNLDPLPGKDILKEADVVLEELSGKLGTIAEQLEQALQQAQLRFEEIRTSWQNRKTAVETEYQKTLRQLGRSAVDAEDFIRLQGEIAKLLPLYERRIELEERENELTDARKNQRVQWEDAKAQEFRTIDRAARRVSRRLRDRIEVAVSAAGNKDPLVNLLRQKVRGRLSEVIDKIERSPDFSLSTFIDNCRKGASEIQNVYAIPPGQAASLANASEDVLMEMEELELLPATTIRLNTAPSDSPPVWQDLDRLSTGQKSTAVLLLLLLESEAPLIVDQPEDDLDNRFITEGIVPKMRDEKRRRQFVFSTHNANIPVLGDAELILGMTATGSSEIEEGRAYIAPENRGSIDSASVRELVGQILEGGKDAFETRRLKYGF